MCWERAETPVGPKENFSEHQEVVPAGGMTTGFQPCSRIQSSCQTFHLWKTDGTTYNLHPILLGRWEMEEGDVKITAVVSQRQSETDFSAVA